MPQPSKHRDHHFIVKVFVPTDVDVGEDRLRWYFDHAIRGYHQVFALESDPIRGMSRCSVSVEKHPNQAAALTRLPDAGCHGLDTPERVCFYEQDFYVLSNFSSFNLTWADRHVFPTSEHCYHWLKFMTLKGSPGNWTVSEEREAVANEIKTAPSAHEAFKIAERNKHLRRPDWDDVKVEKMRMILRAKAQQHEYVRRKLLATGDRELVENSWRDDFWGWGPNRDGKNMLGKLWMEIRKELCAALPDALPDTGRE